MQRVKLMRGHDGNHQDLPDMLFAMITAEGARRLDDAMHGSILRGDVATVWAYTTRDIATRIRHWALGLS